MLTPPVIFGVYSAIRGIKIIVTQKPDDPMPAIAGFALPTALQFSLICALAVAALLILLIEKWTKRV